MAAKSWSRVISGNGSLHTRFFENVNFTRHVGDSEELCYQLPEDVPGIRSDDALFADYSDGSFLQNDGLVELASRHAPAADVATLDQHINMASMGALAVLMFNLDLSPYVEAEQESVPSCNRTLSKDSQNSRLGTREYQHTSPVSLETLMHQKICDLAIIEPVFRSYGGTKMEDLLWIFQSPADAVLATVEARREVELHNASRHAKRTPCRIDGYGIHYGSILFVKDTDVHWGDPVNTASKLGQDIATDGNILITQEVYQKIETDPTCAMLEFANGTFVKSGVEFLCFSVSGSLVNPKCMPHDPSSSSLSGSDSH